MYIIKEKHYILGSVTIDSECNWNEMVSFVPYSIFHMNTEIHGKKHAAMFFLQLYLLIGTWQIK